MGYYCKIVHEDSSDYMVATAPVTKSQNGNS